MCRVPLQGWSKRLPFSIFYLFSNLSSIGQKASANQHIIANYLSDGGDWPIEPRRRKALIEVTAIGMGLMMTAVAVMAAGLVLEATLLMMRRALRTPPLAASLEPSATDLS
jgi:hypothetical protein